MRMTSNNKCISGATEKLRGGFEASLNLIEEDLPEGKYQVYLKVKNLNWVALTASTTSKDQSVDKYNASSKYDIDISGFGKNAQVITEYGRLHGDNGLICSSPVNKNISDPYYSYLKENQEYRINGNPVTACKGDCNSNEANYSQRLFPLSVSSGFPTIKIENSLQYAYYGPGTGIISYAPASWLRFSGHIQIKKIEKYGGGNDTGGGEKPEELKCKDAIEESECTSDETGTHAKFYESENLSSCTLDYGNNSGFELEGTKTTGNQFCTVSCKDDFDVFLPTFKNVTAGQSFDLNQSLEPNHYLPTIKAKRTCVTSKVDYNAFETKLKKAEDEMIKAYNIWKDYEAYYNETLKIDLDSKESYSHCHYCCVGTGCGDGKSCCPSCCGSYPTSYKPWHINQFEGPNGKIFKEDGKEECSGCHPCTNEPRSDLQNSAKKDMNDKEDIYLQKKSAYESLIAEYESCSNWTEEGKAVIAQYYDTAPTIVRRISKREDKREIYRHLYEQYISPCVQCIEAEKNEECKVLYQEMVEGLIQEYLH